jgi:superfamily II DNA helicase RecQ
VKYKFFYISASDPAQGEVALNHFCSTHQVVVVDRQFVAAERNSAWAICVQHVEPGAGPKPPPPKNKIDYKEILSESDFKKYARLRTLRKQVSEADGVPLYAVFSNEQIAAMVTGKVTLPSEMTAIEGVGKARMERYGPRFLDLLNELCAEEEGA